MSKKLPLTDFRAVRSVLEPHDFAFGRQIIPPSDLVDQEVWDGIMHLPEDVSIMISSHNGLRLKLMHQLWADWITTIGDPDAPDEIYNSLLDAADCFQCAIFNFLHGYYRGALAELRTAFELVMIGAYGSRNPTNTDYIAWKTGTSELNFTRCRRRLFSTLRKNEGKWIFQDGELLSATYQMLCNYAHSRPDAIDGALWQSNGPVYNDEAINLTYFPMLCAYAMCYLLVRIARPGFVMPEGSDILFELDWMPDYARLVRAFTDLYGKPPRPPSTD